MKRWYQSIVAPYEKEEFAIRLQARYLRQISMMLLLAMPVLLISNFWMHGPVPVIQIPIATLWLISLSVTLMMRRGYISMAGNTILWSFLLLLWAVMFGDPSPTSIVRVDTIAFAFAVLAIAPLMTLSRRYQLWLVHGVNFVFFTGFCVLEKYRGTMSSLEMKDYIIDVSTSLIFLAVISNAIFTVNQRSMNKSKREMKRLQETKLLLNQTIDAMPSIVFSIDKAGRVTGWNHMAANICGYTREEALDRVFTEVFSLAPFAHDDIWNTARGEEMVLHKKMGLNPVRPDAHYNLTIYPLVLGEPRGAVVRIDDITEQVNLEKMMVQTEKMLSVGGLAAGMAHEINNPLAGILQNLQVLQNRFLADVPKNTEAADKENLSLTHLATYMEKRRINELLSAIQSSGQQAAKVVENMLSFARKESGVPVPTNAKKLVEDTLDLARSDYDLRRSYDFKNIEVELHIDADVPEFFCHSSMIQQVLLNILRNGAQAMSAVTENPKFQIRVFQCDNQVVFQISDNGPGIPAEFQSRIFEPFFTTKDPGQGTGLGLSVSYFIVTESHEGTLSVESQPGNGATFTIALPISGHSAAVLV